MAFTNEAIKVTVGGGCTGEGGSGSPNNDRCDNYDVLTSHITCTSDKI